MGGLEGDPNNLGGGLLSTHGTTVKREAKRGRLFGRKTKCLGPGPAKRVNSSLTYTLVDKDVT